MICITAAEECDARKAEVTIAAWPKIFFLMFTAEKKRYAAIRRGSPRIAAYLFFSAVKT